MAETPNHAFSSFGGPKNASRPFTKYATMSQASRLST